MLKKDINIVASVTNGGMSPRSSKSKGNIFSSSGSRSFKGVGSDRGSHGKVIADQTTLAKLGNKSASITEQ